MLAWPPALALDWAQACPVIYPRGNVSSTFLLLIGDRRLLVSLNMFIVLLYKICSMNNKFMIQLRSRVTSAVTLGCTPNLPTKIIPTKIRWLELSGKFLMGLRIPSLNIKIMLESNPLKSRILVRRSAVWMWTRLWTTALGAMELLGEHDRLEWEGLSSLSLSIYVYIYILP